MSATTRQPGGLRRRILLSVLSAVTVAWLAGAVVAALLVKREIDRVFDSSLQEVAQRVLPLAFAEMLETDRATGRGTAIRAAPPVGEHRERITYVVRDGEGRIRLQSHDADLRAFPENPEDGFATGPSARVYTESAAGRSIRVTTTEMPGRREAALADAVTALAWPLGLALLVALLGVRSAVNAALGPVERFREAVEARSDRDLSPVDVAGLPSELAAGATAVNGLMRRLESALNAERRFVVTASHELRTPMAAALAQTQRLISEVPDGPARARARSVEEALRRLSRLSAKMMETAKAEGGRVLAEEPGDIVPVLRLVLDEMRDLPGFTRLDLRMPETLVSRIDPDAFAIVARNLIENALKHGAADQDIDVVLEADGTLSVTNGGPPLGPEDLARIRRPFQRGATEADGAGLGLAIVGATARAIGTDLAIRSPAPGRTDGFHASIRLPTGSHAD